MKRETAFSKQVLKKNKRASWKIYCNNFNKSMPIKDIWSHIRSMQTSHSRNSCVEEGEWNEVFLKYLPPCWAPIAQTECPYHTNIEVASFVSHLACKSFHRTPSQLWERIKFHIIYSIDLQK